jgi:tetratricopeptide (TPR) repeat protein
MRHITLLSWCLAAGLVTLSACSPGPTVPPPPPPGNVAAERFDFPLTRKDVALKERGGAEALDIDELVTLLAGDNAAFRTELDEMLASIDANPPVVDGAPATGETLDSMKAHMVYGTTLLRENEAAEFASANEHLDQATYFERANRIEVAEIHYRKAVLLEPQNAMALAGLGRCLRGSGKLDEAADALARALAVAPDRPGWLADLGEVQELAGNDEAALETYRKALALKPDLARVFPRMAVLQWRAGDPDAAKVTVAEGQKHGAVFEKSFIAMLEGRLETDTPPEDMQDMPKPDVIPEEPESPVPDGAQP